VFRHGTRAAPNAKNESADDGWNTLRAGGLRTGFSNISTYRHYFVGEGKCGYKGRGLVELTRQEDVKARVFSDMTAL
jgi:hypothetical protein